MSENSDIGSIELGPKQERSRKTYESFLLAAERLFLERGWDSLTTNAVAEAAGASIGSLYRYFPDKAAIVRALAERAAQPLLSRLDGLIAEPGLEGRDALDLVLQRLLLPDPEEKPEGSLCLARLRGPRCSDELGDIAASVEAALVSRVAAIIMRLDPRLSPPSSELKARILLGAIGAAQAEASRDPGRAGEVVAETVALIRAYLGRAGEP